MTRRQFFAWQLWLNPEIAAEPQNQEPPTPAEIEAEARQRMESIKLAAELLPEGPTRPQVVTVKRGDKRTALDFMLERSRQVAESRRK